MQLKNYMEDLVWQQLDNVLASQPVPVCSCEKCRLDIAALALNFLPPRYVLTDMGETYTRIKALELQFAVDVTTAIIHAAKIVSTQPHHEAVK